MLLTILATISMLAPTLNTDGTELTDLDSIRLYLANGEQVREQVGVEPGAEVSFTYPVSLILQRKCFYATAVDQDGNESVPSNTACTTRWRCYKCHE